MWYAECSFATGPRWLSLPRCHGSEPCTSKHYFARGTLLQYHHLLQWASDVHGTGVLWIWRCKPKPISPAFCWPCRTELMSMWVLSFHHLAISVSSGKLSANHFPEPSEEQVNMPFTLYHMITHMTLSSLSHYHWYHSSIFRWNPLRSPSPLTMSHSLLLLVIPPSFWLIPSLPHHMLYLPLAD